jgi:hypothetical protein
LSWVEVLKPIFFMISAEDVAAFTISISLAVSNAFFLGMMRAPLRASWFPNIWKLGGHIRKALTKSRKTI